MFSTSQFAIGVSARGLNIAPDQNKQLSLRCTLLMSSGLKENFIEIDKTEFNEDCLNPDWSKRFIIAYKFTEIQTLRFDTYLSLTKIGETKVSLIELLSAKDGFIMKAIKSDKEKIGKLMVSYRETEAMKETITLRFSGKNLDKKDLFGQSDPYFVISNVDANGNTTEVYRSEVVKQNVAPVWKPFKVKARTLCESNHKMQIKFDCFDWDSDIKIGDKIDFIGSFTTTLDQLINGTFDDNTYELINADKMALDIDSYLNSGFVFLENISIKSDESFLDYLRNGLQFNVNIAVDFTSALHLKDFRSDIQSGTSFDSNDCHFFKSFIRSFCQIISQYNRQNIWTASGFNAIFPESESNDFYEFKTNGFYNNFEQILIDFDSIIKSIEPNVKKSFNIEPTVDRCVESIEKLVESDSIKNCRYSVLLIMTSNLCKGVMKNLEHIIDKTNSSPISVLIIDINLSESPKDLKDITKMMDNSEKLDNRNNIEVLSIHLKVNNNYYLGNFR